MKSDNLLIKLLKYKNKINDKMIKIKNKTKKRLKTMKRLTICLFSQIYKVM